MSTTHFAALEHPSFPSWMREGLDALFAADERIEALRFSFWGVADDRGRFLELRGEADFRFRSHECLETRVTQDELDRIPQVRMFERRADELWNTLPLTYSTDEGVTINGEYEMVAHREGSIRFWHQVSTGIEQEFTIEAAWNDGAWTANDAIMLKHYDGTHSDLLAGDAVGAMAHLDASELNLATMPVPIRVEMDEDESVVFHMEPGELTRCMEPR